MQNILFQLVKQTIHYGQFDQRQRVLVTKSRREKHKSPDIYSLVNSEHTAVGETRNAGIGEPMGHSMARQI